MRAKVDEQSVISANAQFWEQMLAMKVEPVPIEVRIDEKLAHVATAAMLMQPEDAVAEADTLDATREITNMIAGVIKSSLPRPCSMTVPTSMIEPERVCESQRTESTLAVGFRHEGGDLMVRVWEHESSGEQ